MKGYDMRNDGDDAISGFIACAILVITFILGYLSAANHYKIPTTKTRYAECIEKKLAHPRICADLYKDEQ